MAGLTGRGEADPYEGDTRPIDGLNTREYPPRRQQREIPRECPAAAMTQ